MKYLILALAVGALVVILFFQWHVAMPGLRNPSTSLSQIYIHGTPVCVMKDGEAIVARIGQCDAIGNPPDGGLVGDAPFHGVPRGTRKLPPGHPPIPEDMLPDGQRRIPI